MQMTYQNIIDCAFPLFVAALCIRCWLLTKVLSGNKAQAWQEELKAVEESIKGLITKATTASNNLDRTLIIRKRELETLLQKLEQNSKHGFSTKKKSSYQITAGTSSENLLEDLPNQTWEKTKSRILTEDNKFASKTQPWTLKHEYIEPVKSKDRLIELAETEADQVSISRTSNPTLQRSLVNSIEIINEEQSTEKLFSQLNFPDITTFNVARRLLKEGHEIHIVSRKLDVPVAEVRMLDSLMRNEKNKQINMLKEQKDNMTSHSSQELQATRALIQREITLTQNV